MLTTFEIFKRNNGKYYYRAIADSGHNVLSSDEFTDKKQCRKIIKLVKDQIRDSGNIRIEEVRGDQWKFFVSDKTGAPIGYSMDFHSKAQCEKWIGLLKENLPNSNIVVLDSA